MSESSTANPSVPIAETAEVPTMVKRMDESDGAPTAAKRSKTARSRAAIKGHRRGRSRGSRRRAKQRRSRENSRKRRSRKYSGYNKKRRSRSR